MFSAETYIKRRAKLRASLGSGQYLFLGNNESPMNYPDNTFHFRQDSNFLYFFGIAEAKLAAIIDADTGEDILFGDEFSLDDIIWIGQQATLAQKAAAVGIAKVLPFSHLSKYITKNLAYLPLYRADNVIYLAEKRQTSPLAIKENYSQKLVEAIIDLRMYKSAEELQQMHHAVNITGAMHLAAAKAVAPGKMEYEVVAEIMKTMTANNATLAYPVIFSVNGQTLHNHYHGNRMNEGQLVLNDSGAENAMNYAGDITRTLPVAKVFTQKQKEIYEIVLAMEENAIASLKPGVYYKDVHKAANKYMLQQMTELGFLNGDAEEMMEAGVGGLFMPHGLGHAIGLDVHDMEDLGENKVGYTPAIERSTQLGLKSLRFARKLEAGFCLTVEPGIYFIPELIQKWRSEGMFKQWVNYDRLTDYYDFGGVRIEDNVHITTDGVEVLGKAIPKKVNEIEELRAV